jgi:hypothetical protein
VRAIVVRTRTLPPTRGPQSSLCNTHPGLADSWPPRSFGRAARLVGTCRVFMTVSKPSPRERRRPPPRRAAAAEAGLKDHDRWQTARTLLARKLDGRRSTSRLPALLDYVLTSPIVSAVMIAGELRITPRAAQALVGELGAARSHRPGTVSGLGDSLAEAPDTKTVRAVGLRRSLKIPRALHCLYIAPYYAQEAPWPRHARRTPNPVR